MQTYTIYLHRNKINNKCYVGQTCQKTSMRWGQNGQRYQDQLYFYQAIQKYGWDNFEHIILETNLSKKQADQQECYWGGYYHSLAPEGYNFSLGQSNKTFSSLLNDSRSEAAQKNWLSLEYAEKVSQGRKKMWRQATEECKNKMLSNLDRSGKGGLSRSKKVQCVETEQIYNSVREAERVTGICHANISQVCTGKRKTAGKFHWRYIE